MRAILKTLISITLLLPSLAWGAVFETVEWDSQSDLSRSNWVYGGRQVEIWTGTGTPAGGGALTFRFGPGSQTESITGGIVGYVGALPTEFYFGHWVKWSSNWVWHPIGSKIDYFHVAFGATGEQSNVLTAVWGDNSNTGGCRGGYILTVQRQDGGTYNMPQSGSVQFCPGQWYWIEFHLRVNTPNVANGIFEFWINDTQVASIFNMNLAYSTQPQAWRQAEHSPEYGGGGFANIPTEQQLFVDHTVISTTRIGMPGGGSGDFIPPAVPQGLSVQ